MKSIKVGIKHANSDVEFKVINLDYEGFSSQLDYPINLFAFQVPFFSNNLLMFTFEDYESKYHDYNTLGYNTPVLFISKVGSFIDLTDSDIEQIENVVSNDTIQNIYRKEEFNK